MSAGLGPSGGSGRTLPASSNFWCCLQPSAASACRRITPVSAFGLPPCVSSSPLPSLIRTLVIRIRTHSKSREISSKDTEVNHICKDSTSKQGHIHRVTTWTHLFWGPPFNPIYRVTLAEGTSLPFPHWQTARGLDRVRGCRSCCPLKFPQMP